MTNLLPEDVLLSFDTAVTFSRFVPIIIHSPDEYDYETSSPLDIIDANDGVHYFSITEESNDTLLALADNAPDDLSIKISSAYDNGRLNVQLLSGTIEEVPMLGCESLTFAVLDALAENMANDEYSKMDMLYYLYKMYIICQTLGMTRSTYGDIMNRIATGFIQSGVTVENFSNKANLNIVQNSVSIHFHKDSPSIACLIMTLSALSAWRFSVEKKRCAIADIPDELIYSVHFSIKDGVVSVQSEGNKDLVDEDSVKMTISHIMNHMICDKDKKWLVPILPVLKHLDTDEDVEKIVSPALRKQMKDATFDVDFYSLSQIIQKGTFVQCDGFPDALGLAIASALLAASIGLRLEDYQSR